MLCHTGRQLVQQRAGQEELVVAWQAPSILKALRVRLEEERVEAGMNAEPLSAKAVPRGDAATSPTEGKAPAGEAVDEVRGEVTVVPAVVLSDPNDVEAPLCVAVDVSHLDEEVVLASVGQAKGPGSEVLFMNTRELMVRAEPASLLDCGRARALLSWHNANKFCGKCGSPTVSVEGGVKRVCSNVETCGARVYPRTDPVAIMLVYDRARDRCLLGRSRRYRPGRAAPPQGLSCLCTSYSPARMYTCLSGFVEPAEPLEMAVRREVYEEAGIDVGNVQFVASQPWPVGRGGTCELMLGFLAEATSFDVLVNTSEMEDVRWFTRDEVQAAYDASVKYANSGGSPPEGVLWVPGNYAIAHFLVSTWLRKTADDFEE
eukprot:scaffold325_cov230-Pinguiococcus_pyrenoidosus.AAC.9